MTRHTTMEVSPCYLRRGADDPSVASPSVCVGASNACPRFAATDQCLHPEGTTTTWAPAGVLRRHWAEVEEAAAEHATCLCPRLRRQGEGEEWPVSFGSYDTESALFGYNNLVCLGWFMWVDLFYKYWLEDTLILWPWDLCTSINSWANKTRLQLKEKYVGYR